VPWRRRSILRKDEGERVGQKNIYEVMKYLPHRFPFLLVDRVLHCEPGVRLTARKNVTANEPFFRGHFPEHPVFPGVLILEALAQATTILAFETRGEHPQEDSLYLFVGVDNARFRRQVIPGDQLTLKVELLKTKRNLWKFHGEAWVEDELACKAELLATARGRDT
jgi:3-hydroxyacyl-[acyl-carrier-protein] dehydratase